MRSITLLALLFTCVAVAYETSALYSDTINVNPNGPPPHVYNPHVTNNVKGHRYYDATQEADKIYNQESELTESQLSALRMRAKQVQEERRQKMKEMGPNGQLHNSKQQEQKAFTVFLLTFYFFSQLFFIIIGRGEIEA